MWYKGEGVRDWQEAAWPSVSVDLSAFPEKKRTPDHRLVSQGWKSYLTKSVPLYQSILLGQVSKIFCIESSTILGSCLHGTKESVYLRKCYYHSMQIFLPFYWPRAHHVICKEVATSDGPLMCNVVFQLCVAANNILLMRKRNYAFFLLAIALA